MTTTETLENGNLRVHVEFRVRRRGNRRLIVCPGAPDATAAEALWRIEREREWMRRLESGEFADIKALAESLGMDRSNCVRDLALASFAPAVIEALLRGEVAGDMSLSRLRDVADKDWKTQERMLGVA